jgi:hypothetical protein
VGSFEPPLFDPKSLHALEEDFVAGTSLGEAICVPYLSGDAAVDVNHHPSYD